MISDLSRFKAFCIRNAFSKPTPMMRPALSISRMTIVGRIPGMSMFHIRCQSVAPSTTAASCNSESIADRAAR